MQPIALAVRSARERRETITVPYVMVDRRRARGLQPLLTTLHDSGATAVELGFPFSDPIADGPVLEAAAERALAHGTHWSDLLAQVHLASKVLPTAVMTYANPVWRHGLDAAVTALARAGATGLIVPDLSVEESAPWVRACRRRGVALVQLAAPAASPARVAKIARASQGFLYLVSRYGITGRSRPAEARDLSPLVAAAHRANPRLPVLLGFGIRDPETARAARASGADGIIVGSALEERLVRSPSRSELGRWFEKIARASPAN